MNSSSPHFSGEQNGNDDETRGAGISPFLTDPPHQSGGTEPADLDWRFAAFEAGSDVAGLFVGPPEDPDRYALSGRGIGGGEGVVWQAHYLGGLNRPLSMAIKYLRPPPHADENWPSAEERRRWHDQKALLAHVGSEHVVHLNDVFAGPPPHVRGGARDQPTLAYLVMEWVDGLTLDEHVRGRAATAENLTQRLGYLEQLCRAVASIHSRTVSGGNPALHRDIKPSNCVIHPQRGAVLIDITSLRQITDGFDAVGMHTPHYSAPEVLTAPRDARTSACDVYALGAVAAFCLLGTDPPNLGADDETNRVLLRRVEHEILSTSRRAGARDPRGLATAVLSALNPDPRQRPHDIGAWSARIRRAAAPSIRSRRTSWLPVAAAIATVTILTVLFRSALPGTADDSPGATPAVTPPPPSSAPASDAARSARRPRPAPTWASTPVGHFREKPTTVQSCAWLSGRVQLPQGWTLFLTHQNLDNRDPQRYPELVKHWDDPTSPWDWYGAQWFGAGNSSKGQKYEVVLWATRLETAKAIHATRDKSPVSDALMRHAMRLDDFETERTPGMVPGNCGGASPPATDAGVH